MANKPHTAPAKKKAPPAEQTSSAIEEQIAAFIKSGGEIEQINRGVSGQTSLAGPKHITLGKKATES